jgi:hypothetical protein
MPRKDNLEVRPECKIILLCHQLMYCPNTRWYDVVHIIHEMYLPKLPGLTPPITGFAWLVGGAGFYTVHSEIRLQDDGQTNDVIHRTPSEQIDCTDRRSVGVLTSNFPPLRLPREGFYDFIVFVDDEELVRWNFAVKAQRQYP